MNDEFKNRLHQELERNESLRAELKNSKEIIRMLFLQHEEDRKRISRELHDEIAQILTGLNFELSILSKEAINSVKCLRDKVSDTQRLVEKSMETIHDFARDLRPKILDDLGLAPALASHVKEFMKRSNVKVKISTYPEIGKLSEAHRTVLFRVAQEALNNIDKHANATNASIIVTGGAEMVEMEITDDGKSFDIKSLELMPSKKRLGLVGMEERLKTVNGSLIVTSSPQTGTSIKAQIRI